MAIWVVSVLCLCRAVTVFGSGDSGGWMINFIPYYWAPSLEADITWHGDTTSLSEPFMDEAWEFKPNVVGLTVSAVRGDLGFLISGEALDADLDAGPSDMIDLWAFQSQDATIAGLYQWHCSPYRGSDILLHPWVGCRFRHLSLRRTGEVMSAGDDDLSSGATEAFDFESLQWATAVIGLRAQWFLHPDWSLSLAGSMDGLGTDKEAWTAQSWIKFHWAKEFNLALGYRYGAYDYRGGGEQDGWRIQGRASGVTVALELDFLAAPPPRPEPWHRTSLNEALDPSSTNGVMNHPAGRRALAANGTHAEVPGAPSPAAIHADPTQQADPGGTNWFETAHAYVGRSLDAGVGMLDGWLCPANTERLDREKSRFYATVTTRVVEEAEGGTALDLNVSGGAQVHLPNLERDVVLALSDRAVDEKPGTDPLDRESGFNLGLEMGEFLLEHVTLRAGVRSSLDLYASATWQKYLTHRDWAFVPEVRGYYRTDKGLGTIGSLGIIHRIQDRYSGSYRGSMEYGDDTEGELEWIQNVAFAYIFEGDEKDYHRALFTHLSVVGTMADGTTSYQWSPFRYRAPLYKKRLYWEVGPEISWARETGWEPEPAIRLAISTLFWGTAER